MYHCFRQHCLGLIKFCFRSGWLVITAGGQLERVRVSLCVDQGGLFLLLLLLLLVLLSITLLLLLLPFFLLPLILLLLLLKRGPSTPAATPTLPCTSPTTSFPPPRPPRPPPHPSQIAKCAPFSGRGRHQHQASQVHSYLLNCT